MKYWWIRVTQKESKEKLAHLLGSVFAETIDNTEIVYIGPLDSHDKAWDEVYKTFKIPPIDLYIFPSPELLKPIEVELSTKSEEVLPIYRRPKRL